MNFVIGNQFAEISSRGDVEEYGRQYYWQCREVYNHIAPMLETRLSKLARVKAKASVRPATADDADKASAEVATKLIQAVSAENGFSALMGEANTWSEVTGCAFYKITWDTSKGMVLDADGKLREGDVRISVCPPFEIFPENIAIEDIDKQPSIMHAKVLGTEDVFRIWGKRVQGRTLNVFSFENADVLGGFGYHATAPKMVSEAREDAVLVIENTSFPRKNIPTAGWSSSRGTLSFTTALCLTLTGRTASADILSRSSCVWNRSETSSERASWRGSYPFSVPTTP